MSIEIYKRLQESNEFVLSKQFFRSATSIGANVVEAEDAYSKAEFGAKMSISLKEASESRYWLKIMRAGEFIEDGEYFHLMGKCEELIRILRSIVKGCKERKNK